jgi:peptide/nickel transport system substrate-binding protein
MRRYLFVWLIVAIVVTLLGVDALAQSKPEGQLIIAFDTSIAATYFDPAETAGLQTPFVFLYALHDALVKPLPGDDQAPSLAESWTESPDGLVYEFTLRQGLTFHNGDPFSAEDVRFSFLRYKGTSAKLLHERVKAVEVIDAHRLRFVLHEPWPDFLTFYATLATGAAWVVPKKYLEQVGDDGFKQRPVGIGPYRFVRSDPGVELVLEANERYWRKVPAIKRIIFKGIPESSTRLAMLKTGEADLSYLMYREEAQAIQNDPTLRLVRSMPPVTWYLDFSEQWDPKSPWHDKRVRLAANYAIDRQAINEVERMGLGRLTGSIIPRGLAFALPLEPYPYDPAQAKRLLAEAGYANGFDAGDLTPLPPFVTMGESVANDLAGVGIRTKVRSMERAAYLSAYREKKLRGLILNVTAALGNAATRIETSVLSTGTYAYGGYPDLDDLFRQQAVERDRGKREALLHQMQRLMHERVMHAPVFDSVPLHGVGRRVEEPAVGLNPLLYFTAPYEEMRLKRP